MTVSGANLPHADLTSADLTGANLTGAGLSGADLTDTYAETKRVDLTDTFTQNANLTNACLPGANLTAAHLEGADLSDTNLSGANLFEAYLVEANLTNTNLSNANLTDANLSGVNLSQTNLTGTKWTEGLDISQTFSAELRDDPSIDFWNTSFSQLAKAGVPLTVDGIRRWGGGLSSIQITAAVDLGLPDTAAALPYESVLLGGWIEAGFTLEEALEWQEHIPTPERAADWRDCRLTPQEATAATLGRSSTYTSKARAAQARSE